jgi:hypothetical protein
MRKSVAPRRASLPKGLRPCVIGARAAMLVIAEQYLWLAEGAEDKARSAEEA